MARIRTIKPEFPQSESMGRVSREARLCFILLWTIADDSGRLRGNSRMLASLLYPYDIDAGKKIDEWLASLELVNCIARYQSENGDSFLAIINWESHQKIDRPTKSKVPEPPAEILARIREASTRYLASSRALVGGSKDQGEDQGPPICTEPQGDSMLAGHVFLLANGSTWSPTVGKVAEWKTAFPSMDVESQLRMAGQWLKDNPERRKTDRGMTRFIFTWLEKSQNGPKAIPLFQHQVKKPNPYEGLKHY